MKDALAATDAATATGHVLAAELRACGVDLSFTPVLDLDHGASSVIGDRAFHRDPRSHAAGQEPDARPAAAGMANCGKHFPGHGFVKADSHHADPGRPPFAEGHPGRRRPALRVAEHQPHRGDAGARGLPQGRHRPAGFSERWLKDILRGQLGFTGAVFSDDLSMAGARRSRRELSYAEAGALALSAGCDLVLLCNQSLDGGACVDACWTAWPAARRATGTPTPTATRAAWRCCR
jgi:beta-N-acetylhexosaminidase